MKTKVYETEFDKDIENYKQRLAVWHHWEVRWES